MNQLVERSVFVVAVGVNLGVTTLVASAAPEDSCEPREKCNRMKYSQSEMIAVLPVTGLIISYEVVCGSF